MVLAAVFSLGGACEAEDSTDEQGIGEAFVAPIATSYFDEGQFRRTICAMGHPQATYHVGITAKEWKPGDAAGPCEDFIKNMYLVVPNQINWDFCVNLGLQLKVFQGGVNGCVSNANANDAIPLYCRTFAEWYEQVNYNVVDWNGQALRTSGWQPPGGNGCPQNGFPW